MASTDHGHEVAWLLELAVNPGQFDAVWTLMEEMVVSPGPSLARSATPGS
jgi:hypothetical protein